MFDFKKLIAFLKAIIKFVKDLFAALKPEDATDAE